MTLQKVVEFESMDLLGTLFGSETQVETGPVVIVDQFYASHDRRRGGESSPASLAMRPRMDKEFVAFVGLALLGVTAVLIWYSKHHVRHQAGNI